MGNRLSKIYTRTGDQGTTGIGNGTRLAKTDLRIATIGDIDELNSMLGLVVAENNQSNPLNTILHRIQNELFDLGGELSIPETLVIQNQCLEDLETDIDSINEQLEPLKEFILPGGHKAAAYCHLARSICRRAERNGWLLREQSDDINVISLMYLNRLSDFLFVAARQLNQSSATPEILWDRNR